VRVELRRERAARLRLLLAEGGSGGVMRGEWREGDGDRGGRRVDWVADAAIGSRGGLGFGFSTEKKKRRKKKKKRRGGRK